MTKQMQFKLLAIILFVSLTGILGASWLYFSSAYAQESAISTTSTTSTTSTSTKVTVTVTSAPASSGNNSSDGEVNGIKFVDPLSQCPDYVFVRGWNQGTPISHSGVDLSRPGGCPVNAVADGVVTFVGFKSERGYAITLKHADGFVSLYNHAKEMPKLKVGDEVKAGQVIMQMGCTGLCTGTHLHLGLKNAGKLVDPLKYVPVNK